MQSYTSALKNDVRTFHFRSYSMRHGVKLKELLCIWGNALGNALLTHCQPGPLGCWARPTWPLELAGAAGVALCRFAPENTRIVVTDGDAEALTNLRVNLERNGIRCIEPEQESGESNSVVVTHLAWSDGINGSENASTLPDALLQTWNDASIRLVVGADITYEPAPFPRLCGVLRQLLQPVDSTAILYCTERNMETMARLREAIRDAALTIAEEHVHAPPKTQYIGVGQADEVVRVLQITSRVM